MTRLNLLLTVTPRLMWGRISAVTLLPASGRDAFPRIVAQSRAHAYVPDASQHACRPRDDLDRAGPVTNHSCGVTTFCPLLAEAAAGNHQCHDHNTQHPRQHPRRHPRQHHSDPPLDCRSRTRCSSGTDRFRSGECRSRGRDVDQPRAVYARPDAPSGLPEPEQHAATGHPHTSSPSESAPLSRRGIRTTGLRGRRWCAREGSRSARGSQEPRCICGPRDSECSRGCRWNVRRRTGW